MQPEQTDLKSPLPWEANLLVVAVLILVLVGGAAASAFGLVATMIVTQAVLVLPALAWIAIRHLPLRATLRLQPINWHIALWSALIGLACWPVAAGMATLFERGLSRIGPGVPLPYPTGPVESAVYAVLFIFLAPLTEEPVFRGFVLRAWLRRGTAMGLVLSGFLFALIHFQLAALVPLTFLGIALGILVLRSNSLFAAIIAHACYNTLGALFTIIPALRETPEPPLIIAGLIGLPIAVWLIWTFARRFPTSAQDLPPRDRSRRVWTALSFVIILGILSLVVVGELFLRLSPNLAGP